MSSPSINPTNWTAQWFVTPEPLTKALIAAGDGSETVPTIARIVAQYLQSDINIFGHEQWKIFFDKHEQWKIFFDKVVEPKLLSSELKMEIEIALQNSGLEPRLLAYIPENLTLNAFNDSLLYSNNLDKTFIVEKRVKELFGNLPTKSSNWVLVTAKDTTSRLDSYNPASIIDATVCTVAHLALCKTALFSEKRTVRCRESVYLTEPKFCALPVILNIDPVKSLEITTGLPEKENTYEQFVCMKF